VGLDPSSLPSILPALGLGPEVAELNVDTRCGRADPIPAAVIELDEELVPPRRRRCCSQDFLKRKIIRCLKRYEAREVNEVLVA
jgi:hypothetical protein